MLSCAPAKRFPESKEKEEKVEVEENLEKEEMIDAEFGTAEVRVLLNRSIPSESLKVESTLYLYNNESKVALIKSGNRIDCFENNGKPRLKINGEDFEGEKFILSSSESDRIIKVNGKRYRGKIQISSYNNALDIINVLNLEDYVKGDSQLGQMGCSCSQIRIKPISR